MPMATFEREVGTRSCGSRATKCRDNEPSCDALLPQIVLRKMTSAIKRSGLFRLTSVISLLETQCLPRYQGPEQRSREGAGTDGRIRRGTGTQAALFRTVPLRSSAET